MKKMLVLLSLLLVMVFGLAGCVNDSAKEKSPAKVEQVELTVSAAASLKEAAEELKVLYTKQQPEVKIAYNFGASGTLQKQIEEGAPVDLFISAGKKQMDDLAAKDLIIENSRQDLLENELVLVAPKDSTIQDFTDLAGAGIGKISIGTPESVPAGKYAQEALTSLNLWDKLQPKLVLAKDVRQVLNYVETGNVDAGLVYRSDALIAKESKIVATAPAASHKPIVYPMAIIKDTKQQAAVEAYADFLASAEAQGIFEKYGFKIAKK
ncbi:molybdate ABC transporter substrate-binding protein [Desulfotomaculum sp. 1211_IL3151]|uniref:molybdate ABC transporter substrate-binding protein n=1 Tax=Desulfotomaculum sp. 1211_IL3151 TaxID=3084055 RepID=UPI002FD9CEB3